MFFINNEIFKKLFAKKEDAFIVDYLLEDEILSIYNEYQVIKCFLLIIRFLRNYLQKKKTHL